MTDILALDVASVTGYARGRVGEVPVAGSVSFGGRKESLSDAVFCAAMAWADKLIGAEPRPDVVILESLLPPGAMKSRTSRQVRDRLAGLHGVIRAVAHKHGVTVSEAAVGDIRGHFISARGLKRKAAKQAVMRQCKVLGWAIANDNEADACALWSYACAVADPKTALAVVPLFANPKLKVTIWPT